MGGLERSSPNCLLEIFVAVKLNKIWKILELCYNLWGIPYTRKLDMHKRNKSNTEGQLHPFQCFQVCILKAGQNKDEF